MTKVVRSERMARPALAPGVSDAEGLGPRPPPALQLSLVRVDGEQLAVLSYAVDRPMRLAGLTASESQVAAAVAHGLSNEQVARARRTSPGTVAKQVTSIFRKLGIGSRRHLAALMKGIQPSGEL